MLETSWDNNYLQRNKKQKTASFFAHPHWQDEVVCYCNIKEQACLSLCCMFLKSFPLPLRYCHDTSTSSLQATVRKPQSHGRRGKILPATMCIRGTNKKVNRLAMLSRTNATASRKHLQKSKNVIFPSEPSRCRTLILSEAFTEEVQFVALYFHHTRYHVSCITMLRYAKSSISLTKWQWFLPIFWTCLGCFFIISSLRRAGLPRDSGICFTRGHDT